MPANPGPQSTAALPFGTIVIIIVIWSLVTIPLTVAGGIAGKNSKADFDAPCRWERAGGFARVSARIVVCTYLHRICPCARACVCVYVCVCVRVCVCTCHTCVCVQTWAG